MTPPPQKVSLLITNGFLITMDPSRRMIGDGAVAIQKDRIVWVGKQTDLEHRFESETVIDAKGCLVLPGFIDGHNHSIQYLSKGMGDDVHIAVWQYERVYPFEAHLGPEDVFIGALGNFVEMVRNGTTCFADPGGYYLEEIVRAMEQVGIRGIISLSTRDIHDPSCPLPKGLANSTDEMIQQAEDSVIRWKDYSDMLRVWFSLRYTLNVSDRLCKAIDELADRYRVGIHCHCCGFSGEDEEVRKRWGARSLERYERLGLFGPNLYLVHMGFIQPEDIDLLKRYDVKVCHCPSASMHGAYGVISHGLFPELIRAGVTVTLGTDSATAGRFLDLVRVMYLAAAGHKDARENPLEIGAHKALEMGTIEGARGLGWDTEIGSIEEGKKADLTIVDTREMAWHPEGDPISHLIYSASGSSVSTVIINGRVVMKDRKFVTVDEDELRKRIDASAEKLKRRARIRIPWKWPVE
jgi:cytosine/adenosine deaminase-related metal-dependent hydrolase